MDSEKLMRNFVREEGGHGCDLGAQTISRMWSQPHDREDEYQTRDRFPPLLSSFLKMICTNRSLFTKATDAVRPRVCPGVKFDQSAKDD